jgi:Fungalysin metallopeptidase (M36)
MTGSAALRLYSHLARKCVLACHTELKGLQTFRGGANQCEIWRGFAKRGLGTGASQGSSKSTLDGTANTAVPASCAS